MNAAAPDAPVARYHGRGEFSVGRERVSRSSQDDVLLRVDAAGICGTDLHITRVPTTYSWSTEVLGHELSGEVVEGPDELLGTSAVVDPAIMCGACEPCVRGLPTQCERFQAVGITRPGGFAGYVSVPPAVLHPLPPGLPAESAVLAEPLACVLYGLGRVPALEPGGSALVLGGGPIGMLFALVLERAMGRRVYVSEPSEARRAQLAERLAGEVLDPGAAAAAGIEPELIVDTTGFLFAQAVELARPGGVILCFGLEERSGEAAQVLFTQKELTAVSSFAAYGTFGTAVDLLSRGVVSAADVVTSVRPLGDINAAFDEARSGAGLKVLLRPD